MKNLLTSLIKFLVLTAFLASCTNPAIPQNIKPKFKKLSFVVYRLNDSTKNHSIIIEYHIEFNDNGIVHFISNYYDGRNYTGITQDSSFKASNTLIAEFNKVFNGKRKLKSYKINDKPLYSTGFSGAIQFINYTAENNASDSIIIGNSNLREDFTKAVDTIWKFMPTIKTLHFGGIYRNKAIEKEITEYQKKCNCTPLFEPQTTLKELKPQ